MPSKVNPSTKLVQSFSSSVGVTHMMMDGLLNRLINLYGAALPNDTPAENIRLMAEDQLRIVVGNLYQERKAVARARSRKAGKID